MKHEAPCVPICCVGFPHADIEYARAVCGCGDDNDAEQARRWSEELLDLAWQQRADFVYQIEPLECSLAHAGL